jgi:ABC-type dipeptide/oligopeptide/nickel transport system permease component
MVIQAVVLLIAAVVLTLNLVIDLLYGVLDPRIRYQ